MLLMAPGLSVFTPESVEEQLGTPSPHRALPPGQGVAGVAWRCSCFLWCSSGSGFGVPWLEPSHLCQVLQMAPGLTSLGCTLSAESVGTWVCFVLALLYCTG